MLERAATPRRSSPRLLFLCSSILASAGVVCSHPPSMCAGQGYRSGVWLPCRCLTSDTLAERTPPFGLHDSCVTGHLLHAIHSHLDPFVVAFCLIWPCYSMTRNFRLCYKHEQNNLPLPIEEQGGRSPQRTEDCPKPEVRRWRCRQTSDRLSSPPQPPLRCIAAAAWWDWRHE